MAADSAQCELCLVRGGLFAQLTVNYWLIELATSLGQLREGGPYCFKTTIEQSLLFT